ncbi:Cloroperoxidase [Backusella circina FSU 941]|nr:Cloroperoxidase [Backusella circina FSU 941]
MKNHSFLSYLLGGLLIYTVSTILQLEIQAHRAVKSPTEWRALMKDHPYQRLDTDARSPCPMLNTLANHGLISRDGRNIRYDDFYQAIVQLGLDPLATIGVLRFAYFSLTEARPHESLWKQFQQSETLDLDRLQVYTVLEHDVSLTRQDSALAPHDTGNPHPPYVERMKKLAKDGVFTMQNEHDARMLRWLESTRDNRELHLGFFSQFASSTECTLLLNVIGRKGKISVDHLESFLLHERFPEDWVPRPSTMGPLELMTSPMQCWYGLRHSKVDLSLIDQLD